MCIWCVRVLGPLATCVALSIAPGCAREEKSYRGQTTSQWVEQLRRQEEPQQAMAALTQIGAESAEPLGGLLDDRDVRVRRQAAQVLNMLGRRALGAVDELAEALQDSDELVRTRAAMALGRIGPAAKSASDDLVRALEAEQELGGLRAQHAMVRAIGRIGVRAPGTTTRLHETMSNAPRHTAEASADALNAVLPTFDGTAASRKLPHPRGTNPLRQEQAWEW